MVVWTLVLLCLTPHPPSGAGLGLPQRHVATAIECERRALQFAVPANERLVCLPSESGSTLISPTAF